MTTQLTPAPAPAPAPAPTSSPNATARRDHIYPTLTAAQLARLATHGRRRRVEQGEVLVQAGGDAARPFVVAGGRIDGARPSATHGDLLVSLGPPEFTGGVTTA